MDCAQQAHSISTASSSSSAPPARTTSTHLLLPPRLLSAPSYLTRDTVRRSVEAEEGHALRPEAQAGVLLEHVKGERELTK